MNVSLGNGLGLEGKMFRKIRDRLFANMSGTLQGQILFFSIDAGLVKNDGQGIYQLDRYPATGYVAYVQGRIYLREKFKINF